MQRQIARGLAEIINAGIQPFQNLSTTKRVKEFGGDEAAWSQSFIKLGLIAYEEVAKKHAGAFSVGDMPTIADCCLVPQLASARRFGVDLLRFDVLLAIEAHCLALPAFAAAAPDKQPDAVKS